MTNEARQTRIQQGASLLPQIVEPASNGSVDRTRLLDEMTRLGWERASREPWRQMFAAAGFNPPPHIVAGRVHGVKWIGKSP